MHGEGSSIGAELDAVLARRGHTRGMHIQDAAANLALLGWIFTGLLLLVAVLCIAAARGAIASNSFVGLRLPALTRDEETWRAGHAAGQIPAIVAFTIALVFSFLGLVSSVAYWGAIAAFVGGLAWIVIRATRAAKAA